MNASLSFRGASVTAVIVVLLTGIMAIASLLPASSPVQVSPFIMTLAGKYLAYAMLALAVDRSAAGRRE